MKKTENKKISPYRVYGNVVPCVPVSLANRRMVKRTPEGEYAKWRITLDDGVKVTQMSQVTQNGNSRFATCARDA